MNRQISELTERLAPAEAMAAERCIVELMDCGMRVPETLDGDEAINKYVEVLAAVPIAGLRRAFTKLKAGEYEHINRAFIPLPAEFAAMARAEAKTLRDDKVRLLERAQALDGNRHPVVKDEAMRERVKAQIGKFREVTAAARAAVMVPKEPMSDEKAEYYRRILELKDAPAVSAEQSAFRRFIAQELG